MSFEKHFWYGAHSDWLKPAPVPVQMRRNMLVLRGPALNRQTIGNAAPIFRRVASPNLSLLKA
jgi:hypothetical protein